MPTKLYVEHLPIRHIAFGYSVLYELMVSLHVLNDYTRHPLHITWALDAIKQMPDDLRVEHRFFSMIFSQIIDMLWQPQKAPEPFFESELETFRNLPITHFTEAILARLLLDAPPTGKRIMSDFPSLETFSRGAEMQDQARQWLATYFPDSIGLVDALVDEAPALKDRFINVLEGYWTHVFCEQWTELEPLFQSEITRRGEALYHDGILAALENLSPKMRLDHEHASLSFLSVDEGETIRFSTNDKLSLQPSYFLYPSMIFYITTADNDQVLSLSITYPIPDIQRAGRSPIPPDTLLDMLRGISDRTRLQILQLIATKPRSTSEIAQILNLSDAAISKHLKQMQRGGWVTSERSSYYVLYRTQHSTIEDLVAGLESLLK